MLGYYRIKWWLKLKCILGGKVILSRSKMQSIISLAKAVNYRKNCAPSELKEPLQYLIDQLMTLEKDVTKYY